MARLKILGLNTGEHTSFDGRYLVEYDPTRDGIDRDGNIMNCRLVTTSDPGKALNTSADKLLELWKLSHGIRADGKPNRPLSAFTVEIE